MRPWTLLAVLLCAACSGPGSAVRSGQAPELALEDLSGKTIKLDDFRGKVVLIDFWATWCKPCLASMPFYESLFQRDESKGLVVVGINEQGDRDSVEPFIRERGVHYPILLDTHAEALHAFEIGGIPTAILIDREGRVVDRWPVFDDNTADAIRRQLSVLLSHS